MDCGCTGLGDGDRRRRADGAAGSSILASGPNAAATSYTAVVETPATRLTAIRLTALPDSSLPRGGPGRDAYGHFRITGLQATIAPIAGGGPEQPLSIADVVVDDAAYEVDAAELLGGKPNPSRKRGSWAVNAMSDKVRQPRHAVLKSAEPLAFRVARASRCGSISSMAPSARASAVSGST